MFNIGDKIVYPMYGAGVIESIEEKEVLGERKKYYILRIPIDDMKVMIPMDSINEFGIRRVINYNEFEKVIEIFKEGIYYVPDNWSKRYRGNTEKLKSGDIYSIAEVVRDIISRGAERGLSPGEKKILDNAKQILFSELMVVTGLKLEDIEKKIKEAIFGQTC